MDYLIERIDNQTNNSILLLIEENKKCNEQIKLLKEAIEVEMETSTRSADDEFVKVSSYLNKVYINLIELYLFKNLIVFL